MTESIPNGTDWIALQQVEDMAYFRADLCLHSPESYTLEEKRDICNDMISSSKAMLDVMLLSHPNPTIVVPPIQLYRQPRPRTSPAMACACARW